MKKNEKNGQGQTEQPTMPIQQLGLLNDKESKEPCFNLIEVPLSEMAKILCVDNGEEKRYHWVLGRHGLNKPDEEFHSEQEAYNWAQENRGILLERTFLTFLNDCYIPKKPKKK